MHLNLMHLRIASMVGGVILIGFFLISGGSFGGETIVQLDFSMYPELFEGAEVEIDGKIVGELKTYGQANRSGFEVSKGEHTIRIVHPEIDCMPAKVVLDKPGQKVRFMLDIQEFYDSDTRRSKSMISLM